jgi:hypothetical protein
MGFLHNHEPQPQPHSIRAVPRSRRAHLMESLLLEIEHGTSVSQLYANLLARTLIEADPRLRREYGQRLKSLVEGRGTSYAPRT